MTNLDRLAKLVSEMTPGRWRYAQLLDGIEARALIDGKGYHFGQSDDLENGRGIVALRNCAEELIAVARAAKDWYRAYDDTGPDNGPSLTEHECAEAMQKALAALDTKLSK